MSMFAHCTNASQDPAVAVNPPLSTALFLRSLRSCASEQQLTPLYSSACALFEKTTREGGTPSILNHRRLPLQSAIVHWPSDAAVAPHTMRVPRRPAGGPESS